ncbi:6321_t:CDS:2, partial [Diversispora eburnea]
IGIGKTWISWELKYLSSILLTSSDTTKFIEVLKDHCYIFIDLNNGNKYIRDFNNVEDSNVQIGMRVAMALRMTMCPHPSKDHWFKAIDDEEYEKNISRKYILIPKIIINIQKYEI